MGMGGSPPTAPQMDTLPPATGATGGSPTTSPASGGKGGAGGVNPNPYAQPSVYNPPPQQSYYDQAFGSGYNTYNPQQNVQAPQIMSRPYGSNQRFQPVDRGYGLGGLGNAYARRAPQSPMGALKPMDEMQMYPGYDNPQFDGFQGGSRFSRYGGQQYPTEPRAPMEPPRFEPTMTMRQRYGNPFSDNVFLDEAGNQPRTLGPESLMRGYAQPQNTLLSSEEYPPYMSREEAIAQGKYTPARYAGGPQQGGIAGLMGGFNPGKGSGPEPMPSALLSASREVYPTVLPPEPKPE